MRISKDPETRKLEIIASAIELFLVKGYDKTSITDITKNIHVSQGLFYRYFRSKEEIFDIAFENYLEKGVEQYSDLLLDKNKTLMEKLTEFPTISSEASVDDNMHKFYNLTEDIQKQVLMKLNELLVPIVKEGLELSIKKGELSIENPLATSAFILYGQLGIVLNKEISEEEKALQIMKMSLKILNLEVDINKERGK